MQFVKATNELPDSAENDSKCSFEHPKKQGDMQSDLLAYSRRELTSGLTLFDYAWPMVN